MCPEKKESFDRIIINLTVFKAVSTWKNHKTFPGYTSIGWNIRLVRCSGVSLNN